MVWAMTVSMDRVMRSSVLRRMMASVRFKIEGRLPSKEWSTILPTVFAGARQAAMEGRRRSNDKEREKARLQAAQLNNPRYCAAQPPKGAAQLNC